MTTEVIVKRSDGKWTYQGTHHNGQGGFRVAYDEGVSDTYDRLRRTKESYNSPGLWRKVTEMVVYKPRSGRHPTKPREPVFREPRKPELRPRRLNQSSRSWIKALTRYRLKVLAWERNVVKRRALYEQRLAKYEARVAKYHAYLRKMRDGVPKKVRKRNKGIDLVWHPFTLTESFDTGILGTYTNDWRMWYYGSPIRGAGRYAGDITAIVDPFTNGGWPTGNQNEILSNAIAAADSIALNRFHDKLSGDSIHLGQVIAERAQTVGLLTTSVARLVNFLRYFTPKAAMRSALGVFSKRGVRQVSDDYLAFQFGAKPLMDDVKSAAETVAHYMVDKIDTHTVEVTGSASKQESTSWTFSQNGRVYEATLRASVTVRYVCEYGIDNMLTREMSQLGLINPAEIIWEVTPWSFVIDWVLPIGDYIRHLTGDTGLVFRRGTRSERVVMTTTVKLKYQQPDPYTPAYWNQEEWHSQDWQRTKGTISKTRVLLTQPPKVQLPKFKNPLSVTHVLEGIALLSQKTIKFK